MDDFNIKQQQKERFTLNRVIGSNPIAFHFEWKIFYLFWISNSNIYTTNNLNKTRLNVKNCLFENVYLRIRII